MTRDQGIDDLRGLTLPDVDVGPGNAGGFDREPAALFGGGEIQRRGREMSRLHENPGLGLRPEVHCGRAYTAPAQAQIVMRRSRIADVLPAISASAAAQK